MRWCEAPGERGRRQRALSGPSSRLNEGEVARALGVQPHARPWSAEPAHGCRLPELYPSQGFFRKPFDPTEIFDLYEMRQEIEVVLVRLAVDRASYQALQVVDEFLSMSSGQSGDERVDRLVALDEQFHERIVKLSGNGEMLSSLLNINDRIRFFR
jgi:hypothetical protein